MGCPDPVSIMISIGTRADLMSVTWVEPTATDNSGIIPTVTQSHHPGDRFPVGITQVTYVFTDAAGNQATCMFTVTIGNFELPCMHFF